MIDWKDREIRTQIEATKAALHPESSVYSGLVEITALIELFYNYLEGTMDKKMHKVTEKIKIAEKDIKKGAPKAAAKVLKGAEKKNEKLVKIDREVRDPLIEKAKKIVKKGR